MIGEIHGNAVIVRRIAPADVEPGHSTATRVVPEQTVRTPGWGKHRGDDPQPSRWPAVLVLLPRNPGGELRRALVRAQAYPVDAIMCGTAWCGSAGIWCSKQGFRCPTRTRRPRRRRRSAATGCTRERRPRKARLSRRSIVQFHSYLTASFVGRTAGLCSAHLQLFAVRRHARHFGSCPTRHDGPGWRARSVPPLTVSPISGVMVAVKAAGCSA